MYLIDTNIFIELIFGRKKSKECEDLLKKIAVGEIKGIVTTLSLHAVECIIGKNYNILQSFIRNVINSWGLGIYVTTVDEELETSILAEKMGLDFDDGLQYFVAKKVGVDAIISFDKHFDNQDIPRKEPSELL